MEQNTAVKKMMLSIKLEEHLPEEYYPYVRERFFQMYAAGWDHSRQELLAHNKKRVGQFNSKGMLLNDFNSVVEAARKTGFKVTGIYSALQRQTKSRQGWYWKYLPPLAESNLNP